MTVIFLKSITDAHSTKENCYATEHQARSFGDETRNDQHAARIVSTVHTSCIKQYSLRTAHIFPSHSVNTTLSFNIPSYCCPHPHPIHQWPSEISTDYRVTRISNCQEKKNTVTVIILTFI